MSIKTLLSLLVIGASSLGGDGRVLEEELPPEQTQKFMEDVLFKAREELVSHRTLTDFNFQVKRIFFGSLPVELAVVTHNTTLTGPTNLKVDSAIIGTQLPSGSASISAYIDIGQLKVDYSYLLLDFFGIKYEGPAQIYVMSPKVHVTVQVFRNLLTSCQVSAKVTRPEGVFFVTLGEAGGWLKAVMSAFEYFLTRTVLPTWLIEWVFMPNMGPQLEQVIEDAARQVACSGFTNTF